MLPNYIPTSTEISIITGLIEHRSATGTLLNYDLVYYNVPFFVWVVLCVAVVLIGSYILKELLERW